MSATRGVFARYRELSSTVPWWSLRLLAERTGLEPATPGVTGRYSNQLNYRSFCAAAAAAHTYMSFLVGADGIEPPTFAV